MSLCVSTLIANAGDLLDDVTIPDPTTTALRYLNDGRRKLAMECNLFTDKGSFSSVAYQQRYSLANNVLGIKSCRYDFGYQNFVKLTSKTLKEFEEEVADSTGTEYGVYAFDMTDRVLKLAPVLTAGANTTTLNGAVTDTTGTSWVLTDTSKLRMKGCGIVDSEVWHWQYNNTSTNTLSGITRGAEGTTAATHLTGATFTERDIVYDYFKLPTDLTYGQNVEAIFEIHRDILKFYICWQAKIRDTDDTNPSGGLALDTSFEGKFEKAKMELMFQINKTYDGPRTVKEV